MANYSVTYQLPDYKKYLTYDVEADSQPEAKKIFQALMPTAEIKGNPVRRPKKKKWLIAILLSYISGQFTHGGALEKEHIIC